uniref:Uncharacterized protein n=1 Tax=Chromera velia CCMP2878 TaxID=1169474 RepID=A0A0G4I2G8_9ALVE|eukprot:Cvel_10390.t1-p1 / transcript=Cvel_10390.t1 / gene=Cvel_10390 / organism=Chromera_velia_CCMP2878 / gene_product=hypothetical protein / transcript_product=hypothetical protein / location=Cvel_scaffold626:32581-34590(-) / protein_length=670 / sequence_SO=supercontig / SO=protein_coding / is_pseudo=false
MTKVEKKFFSYLQIWDGLPATFLEALVPFLSHQDLRGFARTCKGALLDVCSQFQLKVTIAESDYIDPRKPFVMAPGRSKSPDFALTIQTHYADGGRRGRRGGEKTAEGPPKFSAEGLREMLLSDILFPASVKKSKGAKKDHLASLKKQIAAKLPPTVIEDVPRLRLLEDDDLTLGAVTALRVKVSADASTEEDKQIPTTQQFLKMGSLRSLTLCEQAVAPSLRAFSQAASTPGQTAVSPQLLRLEVEWPAGGGRAGIDYQKDAGALGALFPSLEALSFKVNHQESLSELTSVVLSVSSTVRDVQLVTYSEDVIMEAGEEEEEAEEEEEEEEGQQEEENEAGVGADEEEEEEAEGQEGDENEVGEEADEEEEAAAWGWGYEEESPDVWEDWNPEDEGQTLLVLPSEKPILPHFQNLQRLQLVLASREQKHTMHELSQLPHLTRLGTIVMEYDDTLTDSRPFELPLFHPDVVKRGMEELALALDGRGALVYAAGLQGLDVGALHPKVNTVRVKVTNLRWGPDRGRPEPPFKWVAGIIKLFLPEKVVLWLNTDAMGEQADEKAFFAAMDSNESDWRVVEGCNEGASSSSSSQNTVPIRPRPEIFEDLDCELEFDPAAVPVSTPLGQPPFSFDPQKYKKWDLKEKYDEKGKRIIKMTGNESIDRVLRALSGYIN